jgi:hypothetical protein
VTFANLQLDVEHKTILRHASYQKLKQYVCGKKGQGQVAAVKDGRWANAIAGI